jgi:hypothetical protein
MQFFNSNKCKKPHWTVVEGKLILETANEKHQELAKQIITVLDAQIRNQIAQEIMLWKPITGRKEIIKRMGSIDNALISVQAICADIALGTEREQNGTKSEI